MARAVTIISGMFVVCASLILAARAVGQSRPARETYLDPGACAQPCWQGAHPGTVMVEELQRRVEAIDLYALRSRSAEFDTKIAQQFDFRVTGRLTLGDVVRVLGVPDQVNCLWAYPQPGGAVVTAYFAGGLIAAHAVNYAAERLSPDMRVDAISYYSSDISMRSLGTTTGWRGFAGALVYGVCGR